MINWLKFFSRIKDGTILNLIIQKLIFKTSPVTNRVKL
jgi:hypothetical protein